jgi:hypothetical protein
VADLRVELLVVEDCPHLEAARRDLESVLRAGIIEVPIQLIYVTSRDDAEFLGFQGSPTIRINGQDVVPEPDRPVAFGCRIYRDAEGKPSGTPPIEAIRAAIESERRARLEAFQREEAAKIAALAREADTAETSMGACGSSWVGGTTSTEHSTEGARPSHRRPASPDQRGTDR